MCLKKIKNKSYYLRAPGLKLDAMLKMTKIEFDFIPNPDMYIFPEKATKGGISYFCNR